MRKLKFGDRRYLIFFKPCFDCSVFICISISSNVGVIHYYLHRDKDDLFFLLKKRIQKEPEDLY